MSHVSCDLAAADWLAMWRTLCLDLPLSYASPPAPLADGLRKPSPANQGANGAPATAHATEPEKAGTNRSVDDDTTDFLEELGGCFA